MRFFSGIKCVGLTPNPLRLRETFFFDFLNGPPFYAVPGTAARSSPLGVVDYSAFFPSFSISKTRSFNGFPSSGGAQPGGGGGVPSRPDLAMLS
jgi:hypothetical protein